MCEMGISTLPDGKIRRNSHRFGEYKDERMTTCYVQVPFRSVRPDGQNSARLEVSFDVVEGELTFLIGLPALKAMYATVNFEYLNLFLRVNGEYHCLAIVEDDDHIHLPFVCKDVTPAGRPQDSGKNESGANKTSSQYTPRRPAPGERRGPTSLISLRPRTLNGAIRRALLTFGSGRGLEVSLSSSCASSTPKSESWSDGDHPDGRHATIAAGTAEARGGKIYYSNGSLGPTAPENVGHEGGGRIYFWFGEVVAPPHGTQPEAYR